jgi:hypothetical protein
MEKLVDVIALTEPAYRIKRRRHAAALAFLLCYACDKLGVRLESFVARIGTTNHAQHRALCES